MKNLRNHSFIQRYDKIVRFLKKRAGYCKSNRTRRLLITKKGNKQNCLLPRND
ncbi:hypothetical protein D932_02575 [Enterococcus casseliflavus 14-MB-W-14]|nr:hypothetical protein D932_02575 [Enterococcus casseliflavus 14-MB-W-14]